MILYIEDEKAARSSIPMIMVNGSESSAPATVMKISNVSFAQSAARTMVRMKMPKKE